ncbi:MAG: acyl carrier protein [Actinobacteria bacterium]|nr:acyl carrier protein [Actinomycetota bacterium]
MEDRIRKTIQQYAKLAVDASALGEHDDLYQAGMTSHASVSLMLGLENEFDVEFPDRMLTRRVFESINSIREALLELAHEQAA